LVSQTIVPGANASFTIDGGEITSESNTVSDAISGVTFNLLKADPDTEVTVRIDRDVNAIKNLIANFVTAYNDVASYISSQTTYDATAQKTGGVLFADGTLFSIKTNSHPCLSPGSRCKYRYLHPRACRNLRGQERSALYQRYRPHQLPYQ